MRNVDIISNDAVEAIKYTEATNEQFAGGYITAGIDVDRTYGALYNIGQEFGGIAKSEEMPWITCVTLKRGSYLFSNVHVLLQSNVPCYNQLIVIASEELPQSSMVHLRLKGQFVGRLFRNS